MLPPVDPAVLSANHKFDALYRDLCINKLNSDGSSIFEQVAQKERDVFATDLRNARLEAAKRDVIKSELRNIAYKGDALPDELQELVAMTAAILDGSVSEDDHDLMQEYVDGLLENPSRVSAAIEQNLIRNATALADVITPGSTSDPAQIPRALTELSKSLAVRRSEVATARLDIAHETSLLHELYKQIFSTSIRLLEQTIHGSVSRGSKAKAEYLAAVAEGMAKKLSVQHQQLLSQVYSNGVQAELRERSGGIAREERMARRKIEVADERLEEYRAGRGMEAMANEYAEISKETARVKDEIAKLEAQQMS